MKESYIKFYKKYSLSAGLRFFWDALFAKNSLRKLSYINRQKDYTDLAEKPELLSLHYSINKSLWEGSKLWNSYDYGEGYFYQSFEKINIRGFRNTDARVNAMKLPELLSGKRVLEIGCNTGFLTLSVSEYCSSITGFDPARHLVEIAKTTAKYLNITNAIFETNSFENFSTDEKFDVIISFANHSTYDGNTEQSLISYFDRCARLMVPGGLFLFESHPPEHEGDGLSVVCDLIAERFDIKTQTVLQYGSFLDKNRTFITAVFSVPDQNQLQGG